ncbi:MAG: hypothetical protein JNM68_04775 [Dinghuibacter sp.]|nr:hypothetical protein [Dinghuibacter sp.]
MLLLFFFIPGGQFICCTSNCFKNLAAALPEQLPPHPVSEHESRIKELEEQVKQLELQNATLEKA